jgi:hypothetical protein
MPDQDKPTPPKREYPSFYEKAVSIALVVVVLIIAVLLLIIFGVAMGIFPGGG